MDTTNIGLQAEAIVAAHLRQLGYKIIEQNWRTRRCEIDIIATKNNRTYFVEVKYRKSANWGDGLDAITPKKLEQMAFAAELWVQSTGWQGDYELLAAGVSGQPPKVDSIIEL